MHSSGDDIPLALPDADRQRAVLKKILELGQSRVINNMLIFEDDNKDKIHHGTASLVFLVY